MASKTKNTDRYEEPNPELGSAADAAEASAAKDAQSASPKPTDTPTNRKDKE